MQDIESILKALEPLIRGASIDIIENTKKTVFKNALSLFQEIKNSDYFSSSDKDSFLALGVKLHNKARNLTNESYSEIRSLLKSCAAFIFLGVSQNMKLQGAITVLKILSKSGQEFQLFPLLKPYALICSVNATKLWGRMNSQDLNIERYEIFKYLNILYIFFHIFISTHYTSLLYHYSLPTPEVQIIKLHAYQALIDVASQSDKADEIRAAVTGAMDAVRELSIGSKLSFGRNALQVGMRQVDMDVCADAIITFRLICQALDGVLSNATAWKAYAEGAVVSIENEDGKNNRAMSEHYVYVMKIKAQLAMVFAFTQME